MLNRKDLTAKAVKYFKESPGAGFVLVFMVLLAVSAVFLILNKEGIAERFANWGFGFLIIGVILRIIEFKRHYKDEGI